MRKGASSCALAALALRRAHTHAECAQQTCNGGVSELNLNTRHATQWVIAPSLTQALGRGAGGGGSTALTLRRTC